MLCFQCFGELDENALTCIYCGVAVGQADFQSSSSTVAKKVIQPAFPSTQPPSQKYLKGLGWKVSLGLAGLHLLGAVLAIPYLANLEKIEFLVFDYQGFQDFQFRILLIETIFSFIFMVMAVVVGILIKNERDSLKDFAPYYFALQLFAGTLVYIAMGYDLANLINYSEIPILDTVIQVYNFNPVIIIRVGGLVALLLLQFVAVYANKIPAIKIN